MPHYFLTPVGTSLLTNQIDDESKRKMVIKGSNLPTLEDNSELEIFLKGLDEEIRDKIATATDKELQDMSAELNGIISYFTSLSQIPSDTVIHLLATDTALGKQTAKILEDFLSSKNIICFPTVPPQLNTDKIENFMDGVKTLLGGVNDSGIVTRIYEFKEKKYKIVFNLTGGFKASQGILSTLGQILADETIYIFQSGNELLRIPKLPVQLDSSILEENAQSFLLMSTSYSLDKQDVATIPDSLLDQYDDNKYALSIWGDLFWELGKKDALTKKLIKLPYLEYSDAFVSDFKKETVENKVRLQEKLAYVSVLLSDHRGDTKALSKDRGLQYSPYNNTDGIDHFRITQGDRVSCRKTEKGLMLLHFGSHDYIQRISTGKK